MRRKRPTQQVKKTRMNMNIFAHTSPTLICSEPGAGALREEVQLWVPWQLLFSTRTFNLVALISLLHAKEKFSFGRSFMELRAHRRCQFAVRVTSTSRGLKKKRSFCCARSPLLWLLGSAWLMNIRQHLKT